MPIQRLNHAVLFVSELKRSTDFYTKVLGFRIVHAIGDQAAFLQAEGSTNDHDLGLFAMGPQAQPSLAGRTSVGLYHLAWEVDTLAELRRIAGALEESGALTGASNHGTTKALYAKDPDGLEFEVSWLVPAHLITPDTATMITERLDLDAEIKRYGDQEQGGVGVSHRVSL